MRTEEELKLLRKVLRGKTGGTHKNMHSSIYRKRCEKCHEEYSTGREPCPIPDPWPDSDAELAEECLRWVKEQEFNIHTAFEVNLAKGYQRYLQNGNVVIGYNHWCRIYCTSSDKIKSFLSTVKEMK